MAFNQSFKQFISTPFNLGLLATAAGAVGSYGQGAINSHTLVGTVISLVLGALFHDAHIGAGTKQVVDTVLADVPQLVQSAEAPAAPTNTTAG